MPWFARQQSAPATPAPTAPAPPVYTLPSRPAYTPPAVQAASTPPVYAPPPPAPPTLPPAVRAASAPPVYTLPSQPAYTPPAPQAAPAPPAHSPPPTSAQASTGELATRLVSLVLENWRSYPFEDETLSLLQVGLPYLTQRECSKDAIVAGQTAARLGYIARAAEYSEYPPARESDDDLAQELLESLEASEQGGGTMTGGRAEFAAQLALSEPVDPAASDGGSSRSVPGIDGPSRGRLRDQLLKGVACPADIVGQELQQTWTYGYFLRCTEEFFFDE